MNYPALLSFICGFTSLSLEILWVRLYSFAKLSTPAAFGFVLAAYLLGIAVGAHIGSRACRRASQDDVLWRRSIVALVLSALLSLVLPMAFGGLQQYGNLVLDLLLIASASAVLAFVFPVAHHLGAGPRTGRQGQRFAWVYTSNVMGAALGPLVTGYVLLDCLSLQQSFVVICLVQLSAAVLFALSRKTMGQRLALGWSGVVLASMVLLWSHDTEPHAWVQQLSQNGERAKTVVENRHGIITLFTSTAGDDVVYGGNVYDGRTNLSPERNTNGLHRPLLLTALQPEPRRVLMVGLSIGTWLALVNQFPGVEQVDVIEINAGYLQAARAYPEQARALKDPRVHVIVDDARRWLRLHPGTAYDLVIMNNTWHWRSNSSLLLSAEFLQLAQSHMEPGAVMAFNATGSSDAFFTASSVFKHAYRYGNFVYAADFDFRYRKDAEAAHLQYAGLRLSGVSLFRPDSAAIKRFLAEPFVTIQSVQEATARPLEVITDRNMLTEFKYGRSLY